MRGGETKNWIGKCSDNDDVIESQETKELMHNGSFWRISIHEENNNCINENQKSTVIVDSFWRAIGLIKKRVLLRFWYL